MSGTNISPEQVESVWMNAKHKREFFQWPKVTQSGSLILIIPMEWNNFSAKLKWVQCKSDRGNAQERKGGNTESSIAKLLFLSDGWSFVWYNSGLVVLNVARWLQPFHSSGSISLGAVIILFGRFSVQFRWNERLVCTAEFLKCIMWICFEVFFYTACF